MIKIAKEVRGRTFKELDPRQMFYVEGAQNELFQKLTTSTFNGISCNAFRLVRKVNGRYAIDHTYMPLSNIVIPIKVDNIQIEATEI